MAVDGQQVRVHYDIHDPSYVMVYTIDGEFVCQADWNANKKEFFAKPVVQMAREKRVEADEAPAGRDGAGRARAASHARCRQRVFPAGAGTPAVLVPPVEAFDSSLPPSVAPQAQLAQAAAGRPFFENASDRYEWLMQHRERLGR
jgi:putative transposase